MSGSTPPTGPSGSIGTFSTAASSAPVTVRQAWTGYGFAHALQDELLGGRHEQRATLLVNTNNHRAYDIYRRWGWQQVAQLRPDWENAPLFNVLILPLHLQQ
jgi:hypothetical protein